MYFIPMLIMMVEYLTPIGENLCPIVPLLSSAARIPNPGLAICLAV